MLRSEINSIIFHAQQTMDKFGFLLPPWGAWSVEKWHQSQELTSEIVDAGLGWDITDYGHNDFKRVGLVLFTLRNGIAGAGASVIASAVPKQQSKTYAEKIMISMRDQRSPLHFHRDKTEDIINRGGGVLCIKLYNTTTDGVIDNQSHVRVSLDAIEHTVEPGGVIRLNAGESITLVPGLAHEFWGEGDDVLIGEVSSVNDDLRDNVFLEPVSRFPNIVEDVLPHRLIVADYQRISNYLGKQ